MTLRLDTLWRRIGDDGLPPLAKLVFRGDDPVARIVDVREYVDGPDEDQPPPLLEIEWWRGEWIADERQFGSFEDAFQVIEAEA